MYDFIEGVVVCSSPGRVVILAGGVGYELKVPISAHERLAQSPSARLYTHLHVRQDCMRLYGFTSPEERELFLLLNSVTSIGPEKALKMLSAVSPNDICRAIAAADIDALVAVKGIGRKSAERIVLELRDEISVKPLQMQPKQDNIAQAMAGLMSLGYRKSESKQAIERAVEALGTHASVEELIREALRH